RGEKLDLQARFDEQVEGAQRDLRAARAEAEAHEERAARAESRVAELQAVVDSLGRERTTLRSEAGAMRARVETLIAAAVRVQQLLREMDELRGEKDQLSRELSRGGPPEPPPAPA